MCAIAGGECGLIPQAEGHIYKEKNLRGVFPNLNEDQIKRATAKGVFSSDVEVDLAGDNLLVNPLVK